jgi:mRNA interferase MazF
MTLKSGTRTIEEGDIILSSIMQADGQTKNRPTLVLRKMPPFGDYLVCGFSTQLHQQVVGLDEILSESDADFATSGLRTASLIRLGFLTIVAHSNLIGAVGFISTERHQRLLRRLSAYLVDHLSL